MEKFLIQAGNAEVFDGNERVEDALKYLGLKSLNDTILGMEVPLMAHQAMGVKWMLEKEHSYNKGGCLADEMGLGKVDKYLNVLLFVRLMNPIVDRPNVRNCFQVDSST
jgi:SNF2 family DNA or RNA helicase